jgi:hypothetical protein
MFNKELYSTYYSYESLLNELEKLNINIDILNIDHLELFQIALDNGLIDLGEYLYIHFDIVFELNIYLELSEIIKVDRNIDKRLINQYLVYKRIYELKRYSKYFSKNKKFYYKFNKYNLSKIYSL